MKDTRKTKAHLIEELASLRERVTELEKGDYRQWPDGNAPSLSAGITNLRRTERELYDSEKRFRILVEAAPIAIMAVQEALN
jgi:hypothetical protein